MLRRTRVCSLYLPGASDAPERIRHMTPGGIGGRVKTATQKLDWLDGASVQYLDIACPMVSRVDLASRAAMPARLARLLQNMEERGCEIGSFATSKAIVLFGNYGAIRQALSLYETHKQNHGTSPSVATAMLAVYAGVGNVTGVRHMLRELEAMGGHPVINMYNSVLRCLSHTRSEKAAFRVVEKLAKTRVVPNTQTVLRLLACCRSVQTARIVLQSIEDGKWPPEVTVDERVYNQMISACAPSFDAAGARSLMQEMEARNLPLTRYTYNTYLAVCRRSKDVPGVLKGFKEMRRKGIETDAVTYLVILGAVVDALEEAPRHEQKRFVSLTEAAFEQAMAEDVVDSNVHFTEVARCYAIVGDREAMAQLAKRQQEHGFEPSSMFVGLVADCHRKHTAFSVMWSPIDGSPANFVQKGPDTATGTSTWNPVSPSSPQILAEEEPRVKKPAQDDWYTTVTDEASLVDALDTATSHAS
ncbi:Pentatricopeptide repeat-containing protein [Diplonema papillatum]|nr:Pentatricopeptide repeat-containing protein [Diplonema papillatum]